MPRRSTRSLVRLTLLVGATALAAVACSSGNGEQQLLENFFRAARVRDNTTLGNIAAVSFNPRTEGAVQDFEIVTIGEEQRRTLQLRELASEEARAKQEEADFSKRRQEFVNANRATLERLAKPGAQPAARGKDAEVQQAATRWRDEHGAVQKRLSEARARLSRERAQAVNSLTPAGQADVDVSALEQVEVITKRVTVNAEVRTPDGQTVPRTMVFTMQRAVGKRGGETLEGRWLITGLQQQAVTATS